MTPPLRLELHQYRPPDKSPKCDQCGGPCVEFVCAHCKQICPMSPPQIVETLKAIPVWRLDAILAMLSGYVCQARKKNGSRLSDAISVKEWLEELAEEAKTL